MPSAISNVPFFAGIRFLGCSEAKYKHDYGCDREIQNVNVPDKEDRRIQVEYFSVPNKRTLIPPNTFIRTRALGLNRLLRLVKFVILHTRVHM